MSAILKGAPLKVVFVGTSRALYQLWSFDPEVTSFAQMKGKSVPIAQRGGTEELAMRVYLKAKGLPPDYVTMIPLGTGPARLAAIVGGTQKFAMLTSGEMGSFKEAGLLDKGRMILDFAKEIETQNGGLVTAAKTVAENRDQVKKVLRALWKGTTYMLAEKQGMTDILQKRLPGSTREQLLSGIEAAIEDVDRDGEMEMAAAAKELTVRAELLGVPADKIPPPAQVYDFSIIREVIRELKTESWRPTK
jgi:ABC-type nitrate/sulfonate/bicarbonate transport system substrate-binding protein